MSEPPGIDPQNSVFILHAPSLSHAAHELAQRIVDPAFSSLEPARETYTHRISNKYYAATICLRCLAVPGPGEDRQVTANRQADSDDEEDEEAEAQKGIGSEIGTVELEALLEEALTEVPAVIWLFDSLDLARPRPELLHVLSTLNPPIQLAVRSATSARWSSDAADDVADVLLDLGFQYIDLAGPDGVASSKGARDAAWDEEALQEVREALEVHMWAGMERREGRGVAGRSEPELGDRRYGTSAAQQVIPHGATPQSVSTDRPIKATSNLRKDADGFVDFEEWLNLDDASGEAWEMPVGDLPAPAQSALENLKIGDHSPGGESGDPDGAGFDDSFRPFQSGPTPTTLRGIETIPSEVAAPDSSTAPLGDNEQGIPEIDPTVLLQHLQSVRTQLAGVASEDERRKRAAHEVQSVFRGLGIEMDLAGAFDDDDDAAEGKAKDQRMIVPGLDMDDTGFEADEEEMVRAILKGETGTRLQADELAADAKKQEEDLAELMKALGV